MSHQFAPFAPLYFPFYPGDVALITDLHNTMFPPYLDPREFGVPTQNVRLLQTAATPIWSPDRRTVGQGVAVAVFTGESLWRTKIMLGLYEDRSNLVLVGTHGLEWQEGKVIHLADEAGLAAKKVKKYVDGYSDGGVYIPGSERLYRESGLDEKFVWYDPKIHYPGGEGVGCDGKSAVYLAVGVRWRMLICQERELLRCLYGDLGEPGLFGEGLRQNVAGVRSVIEENHAKLSASGTPEFREALKKYDYLQEQWKRLRELIPKLRTLAKACELPLKDGPASFEVVGHMLDRKAAVNAQMDRWRKAGRTFQTTVYIGDERHDLDDSSAYRQRDPSRYRLLVEGPATDPEISGLFEQKINGAGLFYPTVLQLLAMIPGIDHRALFGRRDDLPRQLG